MSEKPIEGQYGVYTKDGWKIIQDLPKRTDVFDMYMAVEIASNSAKQWCIKAFCFVSGLIVGISAVVLLNPIIK